MTINWKKIFRFTFRSIAAIALAGTIAFGILIWINAVELDAHIRIMRAVEDQMGFKYETPYDKNMHELFIITLVEQDKPMYKAGLKVGDQPDISITGLFKSIVFSQGKMAIIPVIRNGEKISLEVSVPQLTLQDDPSKLVWFP